MGEFKFTACQIEGLKIIEPEFCGDNRGYFMETYRYDAFKEAGIDTVFVQDNQSKSKRGVLRGLHFQKVHSQAKLVRVIAGEIYDVVVDIRKDSPTFGQWFGIYLSAENKKQFYIPKGFAHGFLVLSDEAEFVYKCDDYYQPNDEGGIRYDDEVLNILWPIPDDMMILQSAKDILYGGINDL